MDIKKLLFGTIAGGLALFVTGYLIYELAFGDATFMDGPGAEAANLVKLNIPLIILMELIYGFLLTYIFSRWASISTFAGGLKAGAILGLLLSLGMALLMYATTTLISGNGVLFEVVTWVIRWGIAGGVVGWVLGRN